jgi:hypothetical protein
LDDRTIAIPERPGNRLWDPDMRIDRNAFPSYAEIIHEQRLPHQAVEKLEQRVADNYKNELY